MPKLISHLTGSQWETTGPSTPTKKFLAQYFAAVDSKGYNTDSGLNFYSKDVTFHNQNNAIYHGGEENVGVDEEALRRFRAHPARLGASR